MKSSRVFEPEFELDVTSDIIKESTPSDCHSCALAMGIRYNIPADIYIQSDIGYGNVDVDGDKITIDINDYYIENSVGNESVFFTFEASDELLSWIDDFDAGKYTPPITVKCIIDNEIISPEMMCGEVSGRMSIKDYKMRDIVWQIVICDEYMPDKKDENGKYSWETDTQLMSSGKMQLPNTYEVEHVHEMIQEYTDFHSEYDCEWYEKDGHYFIRSDGPNYENPWEWSELRWAYKN